MAVQEPTWPGETLFGVTPHNSTNFAQQARQLFVGTGGNVTVVTVDDQVITFKNIPNAGVIGPFYIKRVNATNTTATDIVAFV